MYNLILWNDFLKKKKKKLHINKTQDYSELLKVKTTVNYETTKDVKLSK